MSRRNQPRRARPKTGTASRSTGSTGGVRLQKVLADAGLGSRRECETLIVDGRVEVDREVVDELGTRVDPQRQEIRCDGQVLRLPELVYFALNKPVGVVCTNRDPEGRLRVVDLVECSQRVFPVGRLDRTSEGLIVVTNDGELANRLTHPRYEVPKRYIATVVGQPGKDDLTQLRKGVYLSDGIARVDSVRVKRRLGKHSELEIVLSEGKNREVRRVLARVGHKVVALRRIAVGPIRLGNLPPGAYRNLRPDELRELKKLVRLKPPASRSKSAGGARTKKRPKSKPPRKTGSVLGYGDKPKRATSGRGGKGQTTRAGSRKKVKGGRR